MNCLACAEAVINPESGLLEDGCFGCRVRHVSKLPADWRHEEFEAVQREDGNAAMRAFVLAVKAEFVRRQAWRRAMAGDLSPYER